MLITQSYLILSLVSVCLEALVSQSSYDMVHPPPHQGQISPFYNYSPSLPSWVYCQSEAVRVDLTHKDECS